MKILLLTVGFAILLGGVGGAAYCTTMLYQGTVECATAFQIQESLVDTQKQLGIAKGTPPAVQLAERLEMLKMQSRASTKQCEESIFRYQAYGVVSGIAIFWGALMLAVGQLLHRERHFGFGLGEH